MTKEERAAYMKKYRVEHREEINANRRYYYSRNKERFKSYYQKGKAKYRERWNAYQRARYHRLKEQI